MYGCFTCVYICSPCTEVPMDARKCVRTGVTDSLYIVVIYKIRLLMSSFISTLVYINTPNNRNITETN